MINENTANALFCPDFLSSKSTIIPITTHAEKVRNDKYDKNMK